MTLPVVLYGRGSPLSPNAPAESFSNYSSPGHARDASAPYPDLGMAAAQDYFSGILKIEFVSLRVTGINFCQGRLRMRPC